LAEKKGKRRGERAASSVNFYFYLFTLFSMWTRREAGEKLERKGRDSTTFDTLDITAVECGEGGGREVKGKKRGEKKIIDNSCLNTSRNRA